MSTGQDEEEGFHRQDPLDTERRVAVLCAPSRPLTGVRSIPRPASGPATRRALFLSETVRSPERGVLFVDGSNWHHSLRGAGVGELGKLHYGILSRKLVQGRRWVATRYYAGRVHQHSRPALYAGQRRFLDRLQRTDRRISIHLGRLEERTARSQAARELEAYLADLDVRIDVRVYRDLASLARRHRTTRVVVEKAVDVMLAVDMVLMAERDQFDTGFLLSSDGDFTPAVEAVRARRKRVFAVSAAEGARLRAVCDAFIRIDRGWLADCYSTGSRDDRL